jgi:hypothetical protein
MVGCGCKTAAWTSTANTRQNAGCEGCSCQSLPPRTSDRPSLGNHHQGSLGAVNVAPLRGFGAKPQPSSVTLPVRQDIITLRNLSGRAGETWRAFDFICPRYSGLCCNNTPSHGFGSSTGRLQTDRFLLLQRLLGTRSHPTTSWALRPLLGRAGLRLHLASPRALCRPKTARDSRLANRGVCQTSRSSCNMVQEALYVRNTFAVRPAGHWRRQTCNRLSVVSAGDSEQDTLVEPHPIIRSKPSEIKGQVGVESNAARRQCAGPQQTEKAYVPCADSGRNARLQRPRLPMTGP